MAMVESRRADRIEVVSIVTPTDSHHQIAKRFLEAGVHVICDKPLCLRWEEAKELKALAEKRELILCLTHNYSGMRWYDMLLGWFEVGIWAKSE